MSLQRVWMPSPSYSSRGGASVRLIVLHTAEGATTIESLGNFFANPANQVSSQCGADDKLGKAGEYVKRPNKSWTQGNANPVATSIELCGFAAWSTSDWKNKHHNMLRNCADWIAEEAAHFGIPITKLTPSQAQGSGRGVCQHIDLGAWGGGHVDCGPGFPMDYVLDMARQGSAPADNYEDTEGNQMQLTFYQPDSATSAPRCAVVVPNYYAHGDSRMRFGVVDDTVLRVDFKGHAPTSTVNLGEQAQSQGVSIPDGCKFMIVRRDSGVEPVDMVFSRG
jgi:hypothetical protein